MAHSDRSDRSRDSGDSLVGDEDFVPPDRSLSDGEDGTSPPGDELETSESTRIKDSRPGSELIRGKDGTRKSWKIPGKPCHRCTWKTAEAGKKTAEARKKIAAEEGGDAETVKTAEGGAAFICRKRKKSMLFPCCYLWPPSLTLLQATGRKTFVYKCQYCAEKSGKKCNILVGEARTAAIRMYQMLQRDEVKDGKQTVSRYPGPSSVWGVFRYRR